MTVDRSRQACFALVVAVSLGILFAPGSAVPPAPSGVDVVVHLVLFAALAYTGVLAGLSRPVAAVALLAYAALSELIQSVPILNRSTSLLDWCADAAGVGLGVAFSVALGRTARWWTPS